MSDASEAALLERARAGDQAALQELLVLHEPTIYRFATQMCRQPQDAEGVLQETLIAMARSIRDFRGASSASTWLYSIARSFCIKKRRKSKFAPDRVDSLDDTMVAGAERSPEDQAMGRELHAVLRQAIAALDHDYRDVLVLRDVEGLTAPEVAEIVGISVSGVKSRLHRARRMIRDAVAQGLQEPRHAPKPDCPDIAQMYSRHLEGELSTEMCASMEQHLDGCTACHDACDSLKRTLQLCRSDPGEPVPLHVKRAVQTQLRNFFDQS